MTLKTPALLAAVLLSTAAFVGCDANETDGLNTTIDPSNPIDGDVDDISSDLVETDDMNMDADGLEGLDDADGSAMDRIRTGAADATADVKGMAGEAGGDIAATAENLKEKARALAQELRK